MSIRQDYERILHALKARDGTKITVPITLSEEEWLVLFQELPMSLRL